MKTRGFLDQLLRSARELVGTTRERAQSTSERIERDGIAGIKLGKMGQGMVAGGLLTLLLGNRGGRRLVKLGGMAALGTLAYRAWRDYQKQGGDTAVIVDESKTIEHLPAPEAEVHSQAILVALLAASRADGHIDERERGLLHDEFAKVTQDKELQSWLDGELARPLDAQVVASHASSPELAAEMYLASRLVIEEQNDAERVYLDQLAQALGLNAELRASLDRQLD